MDPIAQVWLNIGGTFLATLAGAAVGAWVSYVFTSSAAREQERREQARFEEQQRQARELFEENRAALYRQQLDDQFEVIAHAASTYVQLAQRAKPEMGGAWSTYLTAIESAIVHARDEDYAVLVGLRQYSQAPRQKREALWVRLSMFMELIGRWRRGELDYDRVIAGLYGVSHEPNATQEPQVEVTNGPPHPPAEPPMTRDEPEPA